MTFDVLEDESWPFDRDLTFYLAGPMSGYPEYNFDEFERWAEILRRGGLKIASPHEIDHGETGCKTPEPKAYIEKMLARKKDKAALPRQATSS